MANFFGKDLGDALSMTAATGMDPHGRCAATNLADDPLAELAAMVGNGQKLAGRNSSPIPRNGPARNRQFADDLPPLDYDLEAELARALNPHGDSPQSAIGPEPIELPSIDRRSGDGEIEGDWSAPAAHAADDIEPSAPLTANDLPTMSFEPVFSDEDDVPGVRSRNLEPAPSDFEREMARELEAGLAEGEQGLHVKAPNPQPNLHEGQVARIHVPDSAARSNGAQAAEDAGNDAFARELERLLSGGASAEEQRSPRPAGAAPGLVSIHEVSPNRSGPSVQPIQPTPEAVPDFASEFDAALTDSLEEELQLEAASLTHGNGQMAPEVASDLRQGQSARASDPISDFDTVAPVAAMAPAAAADRKKTGRMVALGVLAFALLGGVGALAWNWSGSSPADTPIINAERGAVREKPEDVGGKVVPNQDQTVYRTVEGAQDSNLERTVLKDGTEEPAAIATDKAADRVGTDAATPDEPVIVRPRTVRTVVVRPDGTIVSSNQPAETNTTPQVSPAEPQAPQDNASQSASLSDRFGVPTDGSAVTEEGPLPEGTEAPQVSGFPKPRPAYNPRTASVAPAQPVAAAQQPAAPVQTASLPTVNSAYAVQVSSRRSPEAAREAWQKISARFGSIVGNQVDIRRTDIDGRGTFYQVRVPANSRAEANAICSRMKSAGGDCFVRR